MTLGCDASLDWLEDLEPGHDPCYSHVFLYRQVLGMNLPWLADVVRAKQPVRLPRVLSKTEVRGIVQHLPRTSAGLAEHQHTSGQRVTST